jgi:hypothetical protein
MLSGKANPGTCVFSMPFALVVAATSGLSTRAVATELTKRKVPAFPGAEGGGAWTPGGRGGNVFVVTSLNDSGPGTLREAVEARGPRIVVFGVAGTIALEMPLTISDPFITIAGHTAPGDGVCVRLPKATKLSTAIEAGQSAAPDRPENI